MHTGHVFDTHLQLLSVEFNLGIGHLDGLEGVSLLSQCFFLVLEVLDPVGYFRSFYLLTAEIIDLLTRLQDIFLAKTDQAQMFVKVLLLSHNPRLLNLERFGVLELDLCAFLQYHVDDSVEVLVDLSHDLHLALLDILPQLCALLD